MFFFLFKHRKFGRECECAYFSSFQAEMFLFAFCIQSEFVSTRVLKCFESIRKVSVAEIGLVAY